MTSIVCQIKAEYGKEDSQTDTALFTHPASRPFMYVSLVETTKVRTYHNDILPQLRKSPVFDDQQPLERETPKAFRRRTDQEAGEDTVGWSFSSLDAAMHILNASSPEVCAHCSRNRKLSVLRMRMMIFYHGWVVSAAVLVHAIRIAHALVVSFLL